MVSIHKIIFKKLLINELNSLRNINPPYLKGMDMKLSLNGMMKNLSY
nr:MAG TPA: hypothetical protein [Caudoviricetes sp.]